MGKPRVIHWNEFEVELQARKSRFASSDDKPDEEPANWEFTYEPYQFRGKTKADAVRIVRDSLQYIGLDKLHSLGKTRIGRVVTKGDRAYCRIFSPLPLEKIQSDCIYWYDRDNAADGYAEDQLTIFGDDDTELVLDFVGVSQKKFSQLPE